MGKKRTLGELADSLAAADQPERKPLGEIADSLASATSQTTPFPPAPTPESTPTGAASGPAMPSPASSGGSSMPSPTAGGPVAAEPVPQGALAPEKRQALQQQLDVMRSAASLSRSGALPKEADAIAQQLDADKAIRERPAKLKDIALNSYLQPVYSDMEKRQGPADVHTWNQEYGPDPGRQAIEKDAQNYALTHPETLPYSVAKMQSMKEQGAWDNRKEANYQGAILKHAQDVVEGKRQLLQEGTANGTMPSATVESLQADIAAQQNYIKAGWDAVHRIDPKTVADKLNEVRQAATDSNPVLKGPQGALGTEAIVGIGSGVSKAVITPLAMAYDKLFTDPEKYSGADALIDAIHEGEKSASAYIPTAAKQPVYGKDDKGVHGFRPENILPQLVGAAATMAPYIGVAMVGGAVGEAGSVASQVGSGAALFGTTYADTYESFVKAAIDASTPEHPINEQVAEKYAQIPAMVTGLVFSVNPNLKMGPVQGEIQGAVIKAIRDGIAPKDAVKVVLKDVLKGGSTQVGLGMTAQLSQNVANNAVNRVSGSALPDSQTPSEIINAAAGQFILGGVLSAGHSDVVTGARARALRYAVEHPIEATELVTKAARTTAEGGKMDGRVNDLFKQRLEELSKIYKGNDLMGVDPQQAAKVADALLRMQEVRKDMKENPMDPLLEAVSMDPRKQKLEDLSREVMTARGMNKEQQDYILAGGEKAAREQNPPKPAPAEEPKGLLTTAGKKPETKKEAPKPEPPKDELDDLLEQAAKDEQVKTKNDERGTGEVDKKAVGGEPEGGVRSTKAAQGANDERAVQPDSGSKGAEADGIPSEVPKGTPSSGNDDGAEAGSVQKPLPGDHGGDVPGRSGDDNAGAEVVSGRTETPADQAAAAALPAVPGPGSFKRENPQPVEEPTVLDDQKSKDGKKHAIEYSIPGLEEYRTVAVKGPGGYTVVEGNTGASITTQTEGTPELAIARAKEVMERAGKEKLDAVIGKAVAAQQAPETTDAKAKDLPNKEPGKNLSEFKKGDTVLRSYDGKKYTILTDQDRSGLVKTRDEDGKMVQWNAANNGGFSMAEPSDTEPRIAKKGERITNEDGSYYNATGGEVINPKKTVGEVHVVKPGATPDGGFKTEPAPKLEDATASIDDERFLAENGVPLNKGPLTTKGGRTVDPPKQKGRLSQRLQQIDNWLVDQGIQEFSDADPLGSAKQRDNDYKLGIVKGMLGKDGKAKLSPSDRTVLNELLWDENSQHSRGSRPRKLPDNETGVNSSDAYSPMDVHAMDAHQLAEAFGAVAQHRALKSAEQDKITDDQFTTWEANNSALEKAGTIKATEVLPALDRVRAKGLLSSQLKRQGKAEIPEIDRAFMAIAKAQQDGEYDRAVNEGRITRDRANEILESAGLNPESPTTTKKSLPLTRPSDEPKQLDSPSAGALEGVSTDAVQGTAPSGRIGRGVEERGGTDVRRDERTGGERDEAAGGVGDGEGAVPVPAGGEQVGVAREKRPADGETAHTLGTDYAIQDADAIGTGGAKTKYRNNVVAIRLLKQIESENRPATRQEQDTLSKYVGWGGLPDAFMRSDGGAAKGWEKEVAELKAILTPEEYKAAAASTRNAHYTSPEIIGAMWTGLRRLGFGGGRLLEPSVGVGNFFGMMPKDLRTGTKLHGVELDNITGGIAKLLYPKADIAAPMGFQEFTAPDGYFDAVVGNPPFGSEQLYDKNRKDLSKFSIHNYFFAKGMDALKPNGVMAMVVTNRMMDAHRDHARQYLTDRAELLGAVRLPNDAFLKNAGTSVTTDILFFRRLAEGEKPTGETWTDVKDYTDANGKVVPLNEYFHRHPEMMLGDFGQHGSMYRPDDSALVAREGQDTPALLQEAIGRLPKDVITPAQHAPTVEPLQRAEDAETAKVGSMFMSGDTVMQRDPDSLGKATAHVVEFPNLKAKERVMGMVYVRDALTALRREQLSNDTTDARLNKARERLNNVYDRFVKSNGPINLDANKRLFRDDPTWPQISALENNFDRGVSADVAKKTGGVAQKPSAEKAAIFSKRTQSPYQRPTTAVDAKDALVSSLSELGRVDFPFMEQLYGKGVQAMKKELGDLIYMDPAAGPVTADAYLSGNVKAKLAQALQEAKKNPEYQRNVDALQKVQPEDIEAVDIKVKPGAHWVPPQVMSDFGMFIGESNSAQAFYDPGKARWSFSEVRPSQVAQQKYATDRVTVQQVLNAAANQRPITVYDKNYDGTQKVNETETKLANDRVADVREAWDNWIWNNDARRDKLARMYNDMFNTTVEREYDGSHLTLPGKVGNDIIELRPHQANGVWRIVQSDTVLADHVVGAGKTYTLVAGAMELRRMGLAKKPMFVVPNHLVGQWAADFNKLYPGANVLATRKEDFSKENRKRLFARITTGDWDAVIVAHSSFGRVKVDPEDEAAFIQEQIHDLMESQESLRQSEGARSRNVKQIEKQLITMQERMREKLDSGKKDDSLYWSELGIDGLFVDEFHEFKNLAYSTSMTRVAGLGDKKGSAKATDMFLKIRQVQRKTGGRNIVTATGTPISNTMAEAYTMQRYMDYDALKAQGTAHFDAWARQFGEVVNAWGLSPAGQYKMYSRFAKFVNMPELQQRYRSFGDVITRKDIDRQLAAIGKKLPIPPLKGGKPNNVVVERSPMQAQFIGEEILDAQGNGTGQYPEGSLIWRSEHLPKKPQKGADNMLKIMSDARKAALDMRLIQPSAPDYPGSKVNVAADNITKLYGDTTKDKGTQLVFIDLSTPKKSRAKEAERIRKLVDAAEDGDEAAQEVLDNMSPDELSALDGDFSVYDDLKTKLMDRGIPENEIAFIHDANTDLQKEEMFAKVNNGSIRVLLGSTAKMGAGMNVQRRIVGMHHLDAPWRPSDLEQREGRAIRQGNMLYERDPKHFELDMSRYATKGTLDSRMWETLEQKATFVEQFRKGDLKAREIEDIGGEAANSAEMKAAASGNPLILEEMNLKRRVKDLEDEKKGHDRSLFRLRDSIKRTESQITADSESQKAYAADSQIAVPEKFAMTVDGKNYDSRKEAGAAILKLAKSGKMGPIGNYGGFKLVLARDEDTKAPNVVVRGTMDHETEPFNPAMADAQGLIQRVTNSVNALGRVAERYADRVTKAKNELPRLRAQVKDWGKADELAQVKEQHKAVIDKLRPKQKDAAAQAEGDAIEGDAIKEQRSSLNEVASTGIAHVDNVVKALKEVAPGVTVTLHKTGAEFTAAAKGQNVDNGAAFYDPKTNAIHINLARAKDNTLFHEAAHPVLSAAVANHPELLSELYNQLKDDLDFAKYKKFGEQYADKDQATQRAEAVVEYMADVASGKARSSARPDSLYQRLKAWIRKMLAKLGFGRINLDPTNLRKFAEGFAQAVKEGTTISSLTPGPSPKERGGAMEQRMGIPAVAEALIKKGITTPEAIAKELEKRGRPGMIADVQEAVKAQLADATAGTGRGKEKRRLTQRVLASEEIDPAIKEAFTENAIYYERLPHDMSKKQALALLETYTDAEAEHAILDMTNKLHLATRFIMGIEQMRRYNDAKDFDAASRFYDKFVPLTTEAGQGIAALRELGTVMGKDVLVDKAKRDLRAGDNGREMTPEEEAEIKRLSERVENAPEGRPKSDAMEDLMKYQAQLQGVNWWETPMAIWYANILSGPKTHAKNFIANAANSLALYANAVAQRPSTALWLARGYAHGIKRGLLEAAATWETGYSPIRGKLEVPTLLERVDFVGGKANPYNYLKYVRRGMVAADVMFFEPLKEMRAYQLALAQASREMDPDLPNYAARQRAYELMGRHSDTVKLAEEQAEAEYQVQVQEATDAKGVQKAKRDRARRVFELTERARPEQMNEDTRSYAARGTYNYSPEGMLGYAAKGIQNMSSGKGWPVKLIVPFTNIIANVTNDAINYSPAGVLRAALGRQTFGTYNTKPLSREERSDLYYKGVIGMALMAAAYALSSPGDDDEEPFITITANGTGDYRKNEELRKSGWQPYSVKLGNTWVSYQYTPLLLGLSYIGNIRDYEKYRKAKLSDNYFTKATVPASWAVTTMLDQTFISSLNNFTSTLMDPRNEDRSDDAMASAAGILRGIAIPNLYTQTAHATQDYFDVPMKEVRGTHLGRFIQDIPVARDQYENKVNALGEPVMGDQSTFINRDPGDPVWDLIAEKQAWIGVPNKNAMSIVDAGEHKAVNLFLSTGGTLKKGELKDRLLTEAEYHTFCVDRGQYIKHELTTELEAWKKLDPEAAQDAMKRLKTEASKWAKLRLYLRLSGELSTEGKEAEPK